jgi:hypothetical protein
MEPLRSFVLSLVPHFMRSLVLSTGRFFLGLGCIRNAVWKNTQMHS